MYIFRGIFFLDNFSIWPYSVTYIDRGVSVLNYQNDTSYIGIDQIKLSHDDRWHIFNVSRPGTRFHYSASI